MAVAMALSHPRTERQGPSHGWGLGSASLEHSCVTCQRTRLAYISVLVVFQTWIEMAITRCRSKSKKSPSPLWKHDPSLYQAARGFPGEPVAPTSLSGDQVNRN